MENITFKNCSYKLVAFDIDGVLTDGSVYIDEEGKELKKYRLTEIDAINDIKSLGAKIVAITGEKTPLVDFFKMKIEWDDFIDGCKDKKNAIIRLEKKYGITSSEVCYIGDGKYDIEAIKQAGLGVCPKNAIQDVKDVADVVLDGFGGSSCIFELYKLLSQKC